MARMPLTPQGLLYMKEIVVAKEGVVYCDACLSFLSSGWDY